MVGVEKTCAFCQDSKCTLQGQIWTFEDPRCRVTGRVPARLWGGSVSIGPGALEPGLGTAIAAPHVPVERHRNTTVISIRCRVQASESCMILLTCRSRGCGTHSVIRAKWNESVVFSWYD